jgi:hypothetical protein
MRCPIRKHGETQPGRVAVRLVERGGTTLVFKSEC